METAAGRFSRLFSPPFFTLEVALAAARSAAVAFDVTANTRVREVVCHVVQCLGLPQDTEETVWLSDGTRALNADATLAEAGVLLHVNRSRVYFPRCWVIPQRTEQSHAAQGVVMEAAETALAAGVACAPMPSSGGPCNVACSHAEAHQFLPVSRRR